MRFLPRPVRRAPCEQPDASLISQTHARGIQRPPTSPTALRHDTLNWRHACRGRDAHSYAGCGVAAQQHQRSWQLRSARAVRPDISLDDANSIERATDCPAMLFIGDFSPEEVGVIEESLSDDTSNEGVQCLWMHPRCNAMPLRQLLLSFQPGSSVDVSGSSPLTMKSTQCASHEYIPQCRF